MNKKRNKRSFTVEIGETPPDSFRIFRIGWNESTKGSVLYDRQSTLTLMSSWNRHGADIMIDLEHLSLDQESRAYNPDAMGWCELEERDGELWAVNVRWTPEGKQRLLKKKQRYISPAFWTDEEGRVIELLNIALCAMPATNQLTPLIAASQYLGEPVDEKKMEALRKILGLADDATMADMVAAVQSMSAEQVLGAVLAMPAAAAEGEESEAAADGEEDAADGEAPAEGEEDASADGEAAPVDGEESDEDEEMGAAARTMFGVRSVAEFRAVIKACELSAKEKKELLALRKKTELQELREVIAKNRNKITPALEPWALSQSKQSLEAFLKHAPVVVDTAHIEERSRESEEEILTPEEIETCKVTDTDPEKLRAHKRKLNAK